MKSRPAPDPAKYNVDRKALYNDRQFHAWKARLKGGKSDDRKGSETDDLTKSDLEWIADEIQKRRTDFRPDLVLDELKATCPVLAYPERGDPAEDLEHMWSQPEMVRFWARAQGERNRKGPTPRFGWTKALMSVLAMTGKTTHGNDAHDLLNGTPALREVFEQVDARAQALAAHEVWPTLPYAEDWSAVPDYSTMLRNVKRVSSVIRTEGIAANIQMLKALKPIYPRVGQRLLLDGTHVAAWALQQWAKKGSPRDNFLRRKVPEAGYRAYMHESQGKGPLDPGKIGSSGNGLQKVKAWRGFYLITLLDQATGLPVIWNVMDASEDEARGIIPMLSELFQLWPDLDTEMIVGDSAWDEDPWCELLERRYGIHPVFRLHPSSGETMFAKKHEDIVAGRFLSLGGDGRPRCKHNQLLNYLTAETPSRDGLRPGQVNKGLFRARFHCPDDHGSDRLGKASLPMEVDWSRLTYYPHHAHGRPDLYAVRQAMLRRLNQIESWHNHLRAGAKLATVGGDRSRLGALAKQEALITLGALAATSLALADQRLNHGLATPSLPSPSPTGPGTTPGPVTTSGAATGGGSPRRRQKKGAPSPAVAAITNQAATSLGTDVGPINPDDATAPLAANAGEPVSTPPPAQPLAAPNPPALPIAGGAVSADPMDQLERLVAFKAAGMLTDGEFAAAKTAVISRMTTAGGTSAAA
jgi:hypothetical protein